MSALIVWIITIASLHIAGGSLFLGNNDDDQQYMLKVNVKPVQCGFEDLYGKFRSRCRMSYLTKFFDRKWTNDVITGSQLIHRISTMCSKYDAYRKCANCTAKRECPDEREMLFESLMNKWSVFCDKDEVADWLLTILQKGYRYNMSLDEINNRARNQCISLMNDSEYKYNSTAMKLMSLQEGLDYFKALTSMLFKCSVSEILGLSQQTPTSGDFWQDMVLTTWLKFATSTNYVLNINEEHKATLQAIWCPSE